MHTNKAGAVWTRECAMSTQHNQTTRHFTDQRSQVAETFTSQGVSFEAKGIRTWKQYGNQDVAV